MNLETVEVGPVVGSLVRTWDMRGSSLWRVEDDTLRQRLGRGLVARTVVEPDRYREVGLLPVAEEDRRRAATSLLLPARCGHDSTDPASSRTTTEAVEIPLSPCGPEELPATGDWSAFTDWLAEVCVSASQRGEAVLVERGATIHQPWPYTLFTALPSAAGWISHVEASPPPPADVQWWDQARRHAEPDGTEQASLDAPASDTTVRLAGLLMAVAASFWIDDPLALGITYTAAPHGTAPLGTDLQEGTGGPTPLR